MKNHIIIAVTAVAIGMLAVAGYAETEKQEKTKAQTSCPVMDGPVSKSSAYVDIEGKRIYVCNRFNNDVSVIDPAAGRELARVPAVREPIAAAVTPDGRALLVANHLPYMRTDKAFKGDVAPVRT